MKNRFQISLLVALPIIVLSSSAVAKRTAKDTVTCIRTSPACLVLNKSVDVCAPAKFSFDAADTTTTIVFQTRSLENGKVRKEKVPLAFNLEVTSAKISAFTFGASSTLEAGVKWPNRAQLLGTLTYAKVATFNVECRRPSQIGFE